MVHGETSTGRIHPLKEIGEACRAQDALFIVDAVATIGGCAVKTDEWKIDAVIGERKNACSFLPEWRRLLIMTGRQLSLPRVKR